MKKKAALASLASVAVMGSTGLLRPASAAAGADSPQSITCVTVGSIYWGSWPITPPVTVCVPTP
jgi:hypothetical protein